MKKPESKNESTVEFCVRRLMAEGWIEYEREKPYARCFYKRFASKHRCQSNKDKTGVQIRVAVSDGHAGQAAMELELRAGLKDYTWLILQNYALPKTVEEVTALIPRLLAMWEAANQ